MRHPRQYSQSGQSQGERRRDEPMPQLPFVDSDGHIVTEERRRIVDLEGRVDVREWREAEIAETEGIEVVELAEDGT